MCEMNNPVSTDDAQEQKLLTVCDVRFRDGAKIYYFDPNGFTLKEGDHVIIDTVRGPEFGYCAGGNHQIPEKEVIPPLRKVLRLATAQDEKTNEENREREKKAFAVCLQKIEEHQLDMQLVSSECAFDGSKILFFFTADERVDFRELVKDLASVFRTRIELRQIGVRDKAKMVGGLGVCGRPFCCKEFLDDFEPVSIKMAKTQSLSLNPTKISGTCGRLMCCLKYEQDAYEDLIKNSPKAESFVDTPDGRGTVTEVNLLRQSVNVRMENSPETVGCYKNCDICVLRNGKAKKTDPPIPADLAPISGGKKPAERRLERAPLQEKRPLLDPIIIKSMPEDIPAVEAPEEAPAAEPRHRRRSKSHNANQQRPAQDKPQEKAQEKPQGDSAVSVETAPQKAGHHRHRGGKGHSSAPKQAGQAAAAPAPAQEQASVEAKKPANKKHRRYYHRPKSGGQSQG